MTPHREEYILSRLDPEDKTACELEMYLEEAMAEVRRLSRQNNELARMLIAARTENDGLAECLRNTSRLL